MPKSSPRAAPFGVVLDLVFPSNRADRPTGRPKTRAPSAVRRSAAALAAFLVALTGAIALSGGVAFAQTTEPAAGISTGELMNACSGQAGTGERSVEFCDGFIVGTGLLYQELRRANVIDAWACATSVPTVDQIRQGFVTWARSNPQHTDERATNGFWRAMAELYPCKQ